MVDLVDSHCPPPRYIAAGMHAGFGPISQTYWRNLRATASAGDYEGRPAQAGAIELRRPLAECFLFRAPNAVLAQLLDQRGAAQDRKSTRLNSSHVKISYAVFCL